MKKFFVLLSITILTLSHLTFAQFKFDPANLDKSEKTIKKLVSEKIGDLKKHNVKKIIIFNCKGEFILSRTTSPGAWESKDMIYYNRHQIEEKIKTTESPVLNQEYCVYLTSKFLDAVIAMFKEAGIDVVPTETWQKHAVYQEMEKLMMDFDKDEGKSYGMFSQNVATRTLTVPAYDYRVLPENFIKMMKYMKLENNEKGRMLEDFDAQAFCNVTFRSNGAESKPNITGIELLFQTGLKKYNTGTKDKDGNKVFSYSMSAFPVLALKDIVQYNNSTLNSRNFIDTKVYEKAITEMYNYILSLYAETIKKCMTADK